MSRCGETLLCSACAWAALSRGVFVSRSRPTTHSRFDTTARSFSMPHHVSYIRYRLLVHTNRHSVRLKPDSRHGGSATGDVGPISGVSMQSPAHMADRRATSSEAEWCGGRKRGSRTTHHRGWAKCGCATGQRREEGLEWGGGGGGGGGEEDAHQKRQLERDGIKSPTPGGAGHRGATAWTLAGQPEHAIHPTFSSPPRLLIASPSFSFPSILLVSNPQPQSWRGKQRSSNAPFGPTSSTFRSRFTPRLPSPRP